MLFSFQSYTQQNWKTIYENELEFTIPNGYSLEMIKGVKTYSYNDEKNVFGVLVFEHDENIVGKKRIKNFYKGILDSFIKEDNEVVLYDLYELSEYIVAKSIQKNSSIFIEAHLIHINKVNYLAYSEYLVDSSQIALDIKDSFFDSFVVNHKN